jgi:pyruvate dehydrogenase E2 component (dihydrolipoamide acetyltransferase)
MSELYAQTRAGSGTPIVLLHGFGSSSATWLPIISALMGSSTVAYDLPGHGRSLNFPNAGSPSTAAKAIIADLGERGVERAHFAGHSMGGAIATLIALMNPALAASLTLLAPGGYGPQINADVLRRYGAASDEKAISSCLTEMSGPDAEIPCAVADCMTRDRKVDGQTAMLEKIAALITRDGRQGVLPSDGLEAIEVPVVALWGRHDPILPYNQMESMPLKWRKNTAERAGHMLIDEVPDTVVEILRKQVDSASAKASD